MPGRATLWVAGAAVGLGLAVGLLPGLSWPGGEESATPAEVCPVSSAPGESAPPPEPYDTAAAAYGGAAPHPVVVIDTLEYQARLRDGTRLEAQMASGEVEAWRLFEPPVEWQPTDEEDVQLVACVHYDAIEEPLSWCHYRAEDGSFLLAPVRLTVVVREARTGRTAGEFPLRSDVPATPDVSADLASDHCPDAVSGVPASEGARTWLVPPRTEDFLAGLRPLVEKRFSVDSPAAPTPPDGPPH